MQKMAKAPVIEAISKESSLKYDKGERRHKHSGRNPYPEIIHHNGNPKKPVGKCPSNINHEMCQQLLENAIPWPESTGDDEPNNLYTVYEGAVYEAATSDFGTTWHAYPYDGILSLKLIEKLRERARNEKCEAAFKQWQQAHITSEGGRRP